VISRLDDARSGGEAPPGAAAGPMVIDRPDVVAVVMARFLGYEAALVAGDLGVLDEMFWAHDATRRFGVADAQTGFSALQRWRAEQPPLPPGRQLFDTQVTTFDDTCAAVTTCFRYPGRPMIGRQSQMWVRFADGWRIVSAHVSEVAVSEVAAPDGG
jgi:hypothetical protein